MGLKSFKLDADNKMLEVLKVDGKGSRVPR